VVFEVRDLEELALGRIRESTECFPGMAIKAVLADALYDSGEVMDHARAVTPQRLSLSVSHVAISWR
jgi:hypothetical protein